MRFTNAQRADLIDALKIASDTNKGFVDSYTINNDPSTSDDPEWCRELLANAKRYRKLRRALLAEEKAA
jgi:hypothetical protein